MAQEQRIIKGFNTEAGLGIYDYDSLANKPNIEGMIQDALKEFVPPVDNTLKNDGQAADAKVTGEAIFSLESKVGTEPVSYQIEQAEQRVSEQITQAEQKASQQIEQAINAIPPNQHLTFKGAVEATYNGSAPIEVAIPIVDKALEVEGNAADAKATGEAIGVVLEKIDKEIGSATKATKDYIDEKIDDEIGTATINYVNDKIDNIGGFIAQSEPPTQYNVLWIDTNDEFIDSEIGNIEQTLNKLTTDAYNLAEKADKKVDTLRKVTSIVETATGETIQVSDSSDMELAGLKVFGKTTQKTTTGKNLVDVFNENMSVMRDGKTVTSYPNIVNDDGSLTINVNGSISYGQGFTKSLVAGQTVTLSYIADSFGNGTGIRFRVYDINDYETEKATYLITTLGKHTYTFTAPADSVYMFGWYVAGSTVMPAGAKISNLQFETGSIATEYEPYTGGKSSPSPEYPQELKSAGDDGNVAMTVYGKNLIKPHTSDTFSSSGVTYTKNADGSVSASGTASSSSHARYIWTTYVPTGTYIVSGSPVGSKVGIIDVYVNVKDADTGETIKTAIARDADDTTMQQFTIEQYCKLEYAMRVCSGNTANNVTFYPMIRSASIADATYEPYKEQTLTISTPNGLPGIPVASGGNYTDENGQQWICDEVDFEKGVYVQRVGIKTLNGAENWSKGTCVTSGMSRYLILGDKTTDKNIVKRCSHFKSVFGSAYSALEDGLYYGYEAFIFDFAISTEKAADVSSWKNWLNSNPVEIHWQLTEPIETTLTTEQLAAYAALHTNYPNTTIFTEEDAGLEVKYVADTKLYVDKKFSQLAEAMLHQQEG